MQRLHAESFGDDLEVQPTWFSEVVTALQLGTFFAQGDGGSIQRNGVGFDGRHCVRGAERIGVGQSHGSVVQLQTAGESVGDVIVNRAAQGSGGGELFGERAAHVPDHFEGGGGRHLLQLRVHTPLRGDQQIARVHANFERGIRRLGRAAQRQSFRTQIQQPGIAEAPSAAALGQQIPTMHVVDLQSSRHFQMRRRPSQLSFHRHDPVHAESAAVEHPRDFIDGAAFQLDLQFEPWFPARVARNAANKKMSEILRGLIGA